MTFDDVIKKYHIRDYENNCNIVDDILIIDYVYAINQINNLLLANETLKENIRNIKNICELTTSIVYQDSIRLSKEK